MFTADVWISITLRDGGALYASRDMQLPFLPVAGMYLCFGDCRWKVEEVDYYADSGALVVRVGTNEPCQKYRDYYESHPWDHMHVNGETFTGVDMLQSEA